MKEKSDSRKIYENAYHALRFMRYAKRDEELIASVREYRLRQAQSTLLAGYQLEPKAVVAAINSFTDRPVFTNRKEGRYG